MYPHKCIGQFADRSRNSELERNGVEAAKIARRLIAWECQGRGDLSKSFMRLEARTGIGHTTWRDWWHLRTANHVLDRTWDALVEAYKVEVRRQLNNFERLNAEAEEL